MGYSESDAMVRVDFFRSSGKWYLTEAVLWTGVYEACTGGTIYDEFKKSLRDHFKDSPERLSEMDAVCLEPYHQFAHPIQVRNGGWLDSKN